jgi:hypothetical protein
MQWIQSDGMAGIYYAVNGDFMRYNKTYLDFRKTQTYKTDGKTFSKNNENTGSTRLIQSM